VRSRALPLTRPAKHSWITPIHPHPPPKPTQTPPSPSPSPGQRDYFGPQFARRHRCAKRAGGYARKRRDPDPNAAPRRDGAAPRDGHPRRRLPSPRRASRPQASPSGGDGRLRAGAQQAARGGAQHAGHHALLRGHPRTYARGRAAGVSRQPCRGSQRIALLRRRRSPSSGYSFAVSMSRGRAYIILNIYTNTPDIWLSNYAWNPARRALERGFEESLRVRGLARFRPRRCGLAPAGPLRVRRARWPVRARAARDRWTIVLTNCY